MEVVAKSAEWKKNCQREAVHKILGIEQRRSAGHETRDQSQQ